MQKNMLKLQAIVGLACLFGGARNLEAREVRTPLPVSMWGYNHYRLPWPVVTDNCWHFAAWGAGVHRSTDKAFGNHNGTDTTGLSTLLFGAETFPLVDVFPSGVIITDPSVIIASISPRFDYSENTAVVGFEVGGTFGCFREWQGGFRARLPFRAQKVELDSGTSVFSGDISDVVIQQRETVLNEACTPIAIDDSFAYRLDFLASLPMTVNTPANRLVKFSDPLAAGDITINDINVTDRPVAQINKNPIHVIRVDGTSPAAPFALRHTANLGSEGCTVPTSVAVLPVLSADGTSVANGDRARFGLGINYTPLGGNLVTQRNLWVVPTAMTQAGGAEVPVGTVGSVFGLAPNARAIQTAVNAIIDDLDFALSGTLAQAVNFSTQRRYQVGDLATQLFINRRWCNYFGELSFGVQFPTGRKIRSNEVGNLLLSQFPTGNNHHFELAVGGVAGWDPVDWFAFQITAYYNAALRHKEAVAAPFTGATIANIGPVINANVSWHYFVGDVNFTFMVPCICPELGFDVGYQAYVKGRDHVSINQTAATDLLGNLAPLNSDLLESRTSRIAHKARIEFFQTVCGWEIFGGFAHTFAGKNVTRDSDWYLGMKVYF